MRLELATYHVRDVQFGTQTRFEAGVLYVDREGLRRLLLESGDFDDVSLEIVRPGDPVRVIHIMDAVEPRWKPEGSAFPGLLGLPRTAGEGRTHRLAGLTLLTVGDAVAGEPTYWREAIVDLAGPGATATPFGSTINLIVHFTPAASYLDTSRPEAVLNNIMVGSRLAQRYSRAVRQAELRAANYLASATAKLAPDECPVYELTPTDPALPRVVYFFQINGVALYGEPIEALLPSLVHPNEILDGALVGLRNNSHASYRYATYFSQTHGVIEQLYAQHGQTLDFGGVILYPAAADDIAKKELMSDFAVKLARMLHARGACSSYAGGGHPCVEFMLICQKCEQAGIRTVQVMPESYGTPEDPGFVFFVPEAVGIVSAGRSPQPIDLPAQPRVIGGNTYFDLPDIPTNALSVPLRYLLGSCSPTGSGRLAAHQY